MCCLMKRIMSKLNDLYLTYSFLIFKLFYQFDQKETRLLNFSLLSLWILNTSCDD